MALLRVGMYYECPVFVNADFLPRVTIGALLTGYKPTMPLPPQHMESGSYHRYGNLSGNGSGAVADLHGEGFGADETVGGGIGDRAAGSNISAAGAGSGA